MVSFSKRTNNLSPSETLLVAQRCREKKAQGHNIIAMDVGESDLVVPLPVQAAAIEAIHTGHSKYTDTRGIPPLREKLAEKIFHDQELQIDPQGVLLTPGLKQAIFYAVMSTVNPGDEVIIPAPYWPSFKSIVVYAGAIPVILPTSLEENFDLSAEKLEKAITTKTKMLILTSPNNPTGRSISADLLREYGRVLSTHSDIWILCDHIYQSLYWGETPLSYLPKECPHLHPRIITMGGFSKTYAMTGWRLGYIASTNDELIEHMHNLQMQTCTHPNSIAQHAAIAALNNAKQIHHEAKAVFQERHDYLYAALKQIPDFELYPSNGAFYLFPRVTKLIRKFGLRDDCALAEYLLEHAHISVVPGKYFGLEGHIRMSFATRLEKLEQCITQLRSLPGLSASS